MMTYRSVLNDRHFQSVIRLALRAKGFTVDNTDYDCVTTERWQLGCWLREEKFPKLFPDFVNVEDYYAIAKIDPSFWNIIPWIAGSGFQQANVLHGLTLESEDTDVEVTVLGATFNTTIALFDYLVDELAETKVVFSLLQADLVESIFDSTSDIESLLNTVYKQFSSPMSRCLVALIASYALQVRKLYYRSGNDIAWVDLGQTIVSLFEAERQVSLWDRTQDKNSLDSLILAVERKSAMPSLALLQVSNLSQVSSKEISKLSEKASRMLGRVFLLVDDLVDLTLDYRRNSPNSLIFRLTNKIEEQDRSWVSDADVYNLVSTIAQELVELLDSARLESFNSDRYIPNCDESTTSQSLRAAWSSVIKFATATIASWVNWQGDAIYIEQPSKSKIEALPSPVVTALRSATDLLLLQQHDGYRNEIYQLYFPRVYAGGICYETYPASTLFRAVVLDSLLDAYTAGLSVPREVIDAEALFILCAKHRDVRGGWSYTAEIQELPPDAETLGQVVQELYRVGGSDLASTCDEAIRLVLDSARVDGSFPTFIIDPRRRSALDCQMQLYLQVIGGEEIRSEVVANLLYGSILYDSERYHDASLSTVKYFENVQTDYGTWISQWYIEPFYQTYRIVSVLEHLNPDSSTLNHSKNFLLSNQNSDGGWGDSANEHLSTAFSILTLMALRVDRDDAVIKRGIDYLIKNQKVDGSWSNHAWITSPWTEEAARRNSNDTYKTVEYSGQTIATAFCLKAMLAVFTN